MDRYNNVATLQRFMPARAVSVGVQYTEHGSAPCTGEFACMAGSAASDIDIMQVCIVRAFANPFAGAPTIWHLCMRMCPGSCVSTEPGQPIDLYM